MEILKRNKIKNNLSLGIDHNVTIYINKLHYAQLFEYTPVIVCVWQTVKIQKSDVCCGHKRCNNFSKNVPVRLGIFCRWMLNIDECVDVHISSHTIAVHLCMNFVSENSNRLPKHKSPKDLFKVWIIISILLWDIMWVACNARYFCQNGAVKAMSIIARNSCVLPRQIIVASKYSFHLCLQLKP